MIMSVAVLQKIEQLMTVIFFLEKSAFFVGSFLIYYNGKLLSLCIF